jgi:hypothetical protein
VWWLNDWEERLQESGSWLVAVLKIRRDSGQTAGQVGFCTRIEDEAGRYQENGET